MINIKKILAGLFCICCVGFITFMLFRSPSIEIKSEVNVKIDLYSLINDIKTLDSTKAILQQKLYYELAKEAGRKDSIDWKIPYSIWMVESKMDPNAKGDGKKDANGTIIPGTEKAFGLGQIHLPTAQTHANPKMTKEELLNPVVNGFTSVSILKDYMHMFNNNMLYAVAAYNAGPVPIKEDYKSKKAPRNWGYVNAVYEFHSKTKDK